MSPTSNENASNENSSSRQPLPFEPNRDRKSKVNSKAVEPPQKSAESSVKSATATPATARSEATSRRSTEQTQIPEVVSRRMIRRMAFFSGIPTMMGIMSFFVSYFVVRLDLIPLPNVAVLFVSISCFGLGFVGLSYGVLSASWEEDVPGDLLGISEFKLNVGRMVNAWRESRENQL